LQLDTEAGIQIEYVNYSFEYVTGKPVLNNINLLIPAKSKVALVGSEGAGKTSLLKTLSSHYSDFSGTLSINNLPIGNYQLESLRQNTGIFLQQQALFQGTLFENIAMGRKDITPENIIKIAEKAGLKSFLNNLSMGFETPIDPLGAKLPNTTNKKILLLRALVNQPALLLMDEPFIGIEHEIQHQLHNYLFNEMPNTTLLVAVSDEQELQLFDYQIEMINGTVQLKKIK